MKPGTVGKRIVMCVGCGFAIIRLLGSPCNVFAEENLQITGDLITDIENGLLYTNLDGQICDKDGNVLPEYSEYIGSIDGYLLWDDTPYEGCTIGPGGKLYYSIPEPVDYGEDYSYSYEDNYANTPIQKLRNCAYESLCDTNVSSETGYNGVTFMEDDGSAFDEVVLNGWFDEYGNPRADSVPQSIGTYLFQNDISSAVKDMHFVDGENVTMDSIKRTASNLRTCYILVIPNIIKGTGSNGEMTISGSEYTSSQTVIVHGNFDGVLNGDSLLIFTRFIGLASDDTPNFVGAYAEIINDRNIW